MKAKLHILLHALQDIRNFGPILIYSTEIFECWNAVFHFCSIFSNHQAPSHDIACTVADIERFKHVVSGGWWCNKNGDVVQAGEAVNSFLKNHPVIQQHLGWVNPLGLIPGMFSEF